MKPRKLATWVAFMLIVSCHPKKKAASHLDAEVPTVSLGKGALPPTLSETGLFKNGDIQTPSLGLQAYKVRVPLWSDGAQKDRFVFVPQEKAVSFNGTKLNFPSGSVFVKHFKSDSDPSLNIETRVIVLNEDGSWTYGTYLWNEDGSTELLTRSRTVNRGGKDYRIPSPKECETCHRSNAEVLGFTLPQINWDGQIDRLAALKILEPSGMQSVRVLDDVQDANLSIDVRARTYMHVNCSTCHNPNGPAGANLMDMRQEAEDTHLLSLGKIFPGKPDQSILFQKISADTSRMPPVSIRPDPIALEIFRAYIEGMMELPEVKDEPVGEKRPDPIPEPEPTQSDPEDTAQQSAGK